MPKSPNGGKISRHMGDLSDGGRKSDRITWEKLARYVKYSELADRVGRGITRFLGAKASVEVPELARIEDDIETGTIHHISQTNVLATHENFPRYLYDKGLDQRRALSLAASSLVAYNSLALWMAHLGRPGRQAIGRISSRHRMQPETNAVWQASDYLPNTEVPLHPRVIVHRMAARIALDVAGVAKFQPLPEEPQPIHIAALIDPFTDENMKEIGVIAENTFL